MSSQAAKKRGDEERQLMNQYCESKSVNAAVQELVLALLEAKPENPKDWLLQKIENDLSTESDELSEKDVHRLFQTTRKITSEIVPSEAIQMIIAETGELLACDRVSLFVYDRKSDMLILHASNLSNPIMVSPGQGIAGNVFNTKVSVNIPDCYRDKRFDKSFDQKSGYVTRSMLVVPIIDFDEAAVGVIQAINKVDQTKEVVEGQPAGLRSKPFARNDEKILSHLTQHVGIALRNAEVYREAITVSERATGLLNTVQSLSQDLGTQSLLLMVTTHANKIVSAQRATVFLIDDAKDQLWSVSTDTGVEIRIPKHAGIAGECCLEGQVINIPDAYKDSRFNQAFDKKSGFKTHSILAIPMFQDQSKMNYSSRNGEDAGVIGVIQMINKTSYDGHLESFDDHDVEVMVLFSQFVGPKLGQSNMMRKDGGGKEGSSAEAALALGSADNLKAGGQASGKHRFSGAGMGAFQEQDGEEDDF